MRLGDLADGLLRQIEDAGASLQGALFDTVLRLGVTGLSRAGKTVFITGLAANLLRRSRMQGLRAEAAGRIEAVFLQPQPDATVPRFAFEEHLAAMTGPDPRWPASTSGISQLRLSFRVRPRGLLGGVQGARSVHLDIIDYPGEWLLDLPLVEMSYRQWSASVLAAAARPGRQAHAKAWQAALAGVDPAAPFVETQAQALASAWRTYLAAVRDAGLTHDAPGRFLMPGDLAGSPALTFAPLPEPAARPPRGSLWREMERRFDAYRRQVARPFFAEHFARIDRQVVLLDLLGAIHAGPAAVADMQAAMADILAAFRPGRTSWLGRMLGSRRVERILFAATKADHIHSSQHGRLAAIAEAMLEQAVARARFAGAAVQAVALAGLRVTVEEERRHDGRVLGMVRGRLADGRQVALWPGALPEDPGAILHPAREGATRWLDGDYGLMNFLPQPVRLGPTDGPPHIRLDRAAEFLIGDRL